MEWLTLLKLAFEADNAKTVEELYKYVGVLREHIVILQEHIENALQDIGVALFCFLIFCISDIVWMLCTESKVKKLKLRVKQTEDALEITQAKVDKLVPLVEKAAGVTIV